MEEPKNGASEQEQARQLSQQQLMMLDIDGIADQIRTAMHLRINEGWQPDW